MGLPPGIALKLSVLAEVVHLSTRSSKGLSKSQGLVIIVSMADERNEAVRQENRKMRFLRFLVDFSVRSIQEEDLSFEEALKVVEDVKRTACRLFPGKEEVFELVYRPRFNRIIRNKYHIEEQPS